MKKYSLQRRFEVWAETEIEAENLIEACAKAQKLSFTDLFRPKAGVLINDATILPGTGAVEQW